MAKVVLYTKSYCPYSKSCKLFLEEKKVDYSEMVVDEDPALEKEMEVKSGGRTDTPQVFINDHHVGTFDDLKALDSQEELDNMLDL